MLSLWENVNKEKKKKQCAPLHEGTIIRSRRKVIGDANTSASLIIDTAFVYLLQYLGVTVLNWYNICLSVYNNYYSTTFPSGQGPRVYFSTQVPSAGLNAKFLKQLHSV